jgi:hypothetical protein
MRKAVGTEISIHGDDSAYVLTFTLMHSSYCLFMEGTTRDSDLRPYKEFLLRSALRGNIPIHLQ